MLLHFPVVFLLFLFMVFAHLPMWDAEMPWGNGNEVSFLAVDDFMASVGQAGQAVYAMWVSSWMIYAYLEYILQ